MMQIVFSIKIENFSKVTQFLSLSRVSLLKFFGKCSESVNVDANNNLQGGFIPVEVQSHAQQLAPKNN